MASKLAELRIGLVYGRFSHQLKIIPPALMTELEWFALIETIRRVIVDPVRARAIMTDDNWDRHS